MKSKGQWIANCREDRVERIARASIYVLQVGPPKPNQMQTQANLEAEGLVGLYRVAEKDAQTSLHDQNQYLESSDFLPSPESLKNLLSYMVSRN